METKAWVRCLKTSHVRRYWPSGLKHKTNHSIEILFCFSVIDDEGILESAETFVQTRYGLQNYFLKPIFTELVCHQPRAY